jgi:hypothetical protein
MARLIILGFAISGVAHLGDWWCHRRGLRPKPRRRLARGLRIRVS